MQYKRNQNIILLSILFIIVSVFLQTKELFIHNNDYKINYKFINTKDIATTKISKKESKNDYNGTTTYTFKEVSLKPIKEIETPKKEEPIVPKQIWYLPTEIGVITQYPSYWHMAYDITSPRTYSENIFPVANGTISGIYTDSAGAKVITVLHDINGIKYTSLYAHLSRYADGVYIGKPVTINDSLGLMGSTGYSTGPHLHLVVLDCAMFNPNDYNCSDINKFINYSRIRISQGYVGLGSLMNVPYNWQGR